MSHSARSSIMPLDDGEDAISSTMQLFHTRNFMTLSLKQRSTSRKVSWLGAVANDVAADLGSGAASRRAGKPTNCPRSAAEDNTPAPWPAKAPDVEGWGDSSLARPWLREPGRDVVDSILLIITGYALHRSGMEDDPAVTGLVVVLAVAVAVVVVEFMMVAMSMVRYPGKERMGCGVTAHIRQREACLSLRTTLYCHDPTPHNPTCHHTEAWCIPIEPPVLTVPTHTGSLLTKSCGSERFLTSWLWLPVQVARPLYSTTPNQMTYPPNPIPFSCALVTTIISIFSSQPPLS